TQSFPIVLDITLAYYRFLLRIGKGSKLFIEGAWMDSYPDVRVKAVAIKFNEFLYWKKHSLSEGN
ncbi:hypothetical protein FRX31_023163, partial [Thalictrum thalictroides]